MTISALLPILQLILSLGNISIMGYALYKFLNKPRNNHEVRISVLEEEVKDIKRSLDKDDIKFKEQEEANQVLIHSVLALIEFEIQYCLTEHKEMSKGLEIAKEDLNRYLARK